MFTWPTAAQLPAAAHPSPRLTTTSSHHHSIDLMVMMIIDASLLLLPHRLLLPGLHLTSSSQRRAGGTSILAAYWSPPHLLYCILSTLKPPISFLLFIRSGPLKFEIFTLSINCLSRGSL